MAALACAAGAGSSGRPTWLQGEHPRFPRSSAITGVGAGSSLESARNNARAEIARVFEARVEAMVADQTTRIRKVTSRAATSETLEKLVVSTSVTSRGEFREIYVAETWLDRAAGTHYALAVLDKAKMRAGLRPELEGASRGVAGHLDRARGAATSLARARALVAALRASNEWDALESRARVVGGPVVESPASTAEIERDLAAVLDQVRFIVEVAELDAGTGAVRGSLPMFQSRLAESVTELGFSVVDVDSGPASAAPLRLSCRVSLQEIPRKLPNTYFYRWEAAYEVAGRPPAGPVVLTMEASGGESFSTPELARQRAIAKGSSEIARDVTQRISRYLREGSEH
jgi:hypothetical protein